MSQQSNSANTTDLVPSENDRTMAAIGHGLTFVEGGIVGPLIVYILQREQSPFVAFHSLQSLLFGLLFLVVVSVYAMLGMVTLGLGLLVLLPVVFAASVFYMVFEVIAVIKAHNGEWYTLPFVGAWALRIHPPPSA